MESNITNPHLLINENYWKMMKTNWRTSTSLPKMCLICGSTINLESHHTNALRKTTLKKDKKKEPLYKFLSSINRKQILLCHKHHQQVHQGKYSGLSLKNIYDERLPRISNFLITEPSELQKEQTEKNLKFLFADKFHYKYQPERKVVIIPYLKTRKRPRYSYNPTIEKGERPTIIQNFIFKYLNKQT
jgi:hypothetical protein